MRRLGAEDYAVDAVTAAKALVGAWLCRRLEDGSVVRRRITETEAYCGEEDTACHAHKGRTARTGRFVGSVPVCRYVGPLGTVSGVTKCQSSLIQVRQAKLGRTDSGRSYIVKKSTYD